MKAYDVIVVGSGCGAIIAGEAAEQGLSVALVEEGLMGGTCLNFGCIPSKMLLYPADRIVEIQEAQKLGIRAEVKEVEFPAILERMRTSIRADREQMRKAILDYGAIDLYETEAHFTGELTLDAGGQAIRGKQIFLATGARTFIPPIDGLADVDYLTNESVLELTAKPEDLIIIGGGYIAVEFAHFFAAMGTRVTILEMAERLLTSEEPEISELLLRKLSERMTVHLNSQALKVEQSAGKITVLVKDKTGGQEQTYSASRLMVAVGRQSNADRLQLEKTGVELDGRGYIKVDDQLQTTRKGIWAVGDANGLQMFRHMANEQAALATHIAFHKAKLKLNTTVVPRAVFTHPQIASVGLTEAAALKGDYQVTVGKARYTDTAKGNAMLENDSFAKVVLEKGSHKLLGFHIVGSYAPELIQEVTNAMLSGGELEELSSGIHIHPALSELISYTLASVPPD
jgi:dihydrolipoamide dehydrogenase